MASKNIVVVSAGLGRPSSTRLLADRLAEATARSLLGSGVPAEFEVVELRDLAHEITDAMLTGFAPEALAGVIDRVTRADGLIAVTPVFTASYSGLFKSFFDVMDKEALAGTPVLLGATAGTARHSLVLDHALRPCSRTSGRSSVRPRSSPRRRTGASATDDHGSAERVTRAADEFAELVSRHSTTRDDPFADLVPFDQQLSRLAGDDPA